MAAEKWNESGRVWEEDHGLLDAEQVAKCKRADLAEAAAELIDVANQNGGRDNISVVLVRVPADFLPSGGWLQRWMAKKPT
jgi:protein phosphatase